MDYPCIVPYYYRNVKGQTVQDLFRAICTTCRAAGRPENRGFAFKIEHGGVNDIKAHLGGKTHEESIERIKGQGSIDQHTDE